MEGLNKKINDGLPPVYPGIRALKMIPPVPLAPSSYKVWDKPHVQGDAVAAARVDIPGPSAPAIPGAAAIPVAPAGADSNLVNQVQPVPKPDPKTDHKRFQRLIANRASAQRCRMKKLEFVIGMEKKLRELEAQVAYLSPQVANQRSRQQFLQMERIKLNQELFALTGSKALKEAEFEKSKAEVIGLRKLHAEIEQNKAEAIRLRKLLLSSQQQEKLHGITPVWEERFEPMVNLNQPNPSGIGQMSYMTSKKEPNGEAKVAMEQMNQLNIEVPEQQMEGFGNWSPVLHNGMASSSLFQSGPSMLPEPVDARPNLGSIGEQILNFDFKYSN